MPSSSSKKHDQTVLQILHITSINAQGQRNTPKNISNNWKRKILLSKDIKYIKIHFCILLSLYIILSELSSNEYVSRWWADFFLLIFYVLFHINQLKVLYASFHFSTVWIPYSNPVIFCPHNVLTKPFCLSLKPLGKASQLFFYRFDLMTYLVAWVTHINFLEFSNFNLSCQLLLSLWLFCRNLNSCPIQAADWD